MTNKEVREAAERLIELIGKFNKKKPLNHEQQDVITVCTAILSTKRYRK